jgi:serine/threonine protein kinase
LRLLHRRGICHGDITPRNVFLRKGELVLGDLGIAKQGLHDGPIYLGAGTPAVFAPPDADGSSWTPADDVYQLALIALSALAGEIVVTYEVCGRLLKSLEASDATKGWIRDALAARGDRFVDASEALAALREEPIKPARPPRSLRGHHVVFTGKLSSTRAVAQRQAKAAGAIVQGRVNGATSVIVAGQPNPLQIGQQYGTKLYDAHRRIRRGQRISIIDEDRFSRLARRA